MRACYLAKQTIDNNIQVHCGANNLKVSRKILL